MVKQIFRVLIKEAVRSIRAPTAKQEEAYGRLLHTLSAACYVGAASIMFSSTSSTSFWYDALRVVSLFVVGVALSIVGAILSKGE